MVNIVHYFICGPRVEITGESDLPFHVKFINKSTDLVEYEVDIGINSFAQCAKSYYQDWNIIIEQENKEISNYHLSLENQHVLIRFHDKALGDTLAWIPYIEEFRKKHKCKVTCLTFFNELFSKVYPEINFVNMTDKVSDVFAIYGVGCFSPDDRNKSPRPWFNLSLQDMAKDLLGLQELGEIKPRVYFDESQDIHKDKKNLICIATESTLGCKYWQNPNGWKSVVSWLIKLGYNVVNISRGGIALDGVKNVSEQESLQSIMSYLRHCKLFVGLPSGISWLAWALNKKVIMVSGFSEPWTEFSDKIHVGPPPGKCHGCFNKYEFDKNNWNWCPENKGFECTKSITGQKVKDVIKKLIK